MNLLEIGARPPLNRQLSPSPREFNIQAAYLQIGASIDPRSRRHRCASGHVID
jgi:hypothetical protein